MSAMQLSFLYVLVIVVVLTYFSEVSSFSPSIGIQRSIGTGINGRSLNSPLYRIEVSNFEYYHGFYSSDTAVCFLQQQLHNIIYVYWMWQTFRRVCYASNIKLLQNHSFQENSLLTDLLYISLHFS